MIRITSSEGPMFADDDGTPYGGLPEEYNNIVKFDVKRLERMCMANHIPLAREWDILAVGYWTDDGQYETPAPSYAENGVMRHIWSGQAEDYYEACEIGGDY